MTLRAILRSATATFGNLTFSVLFVVALGLSGADAREGPVPQSARSAPPTPAPGSLERAFWACDYAGSTRWVGPEEGVACVAIYEELKRKKFAGDFESLLAWWLRNKATEHRAQAARAAAGDVLGNR